MTRRRYPSDLSDEQWAELRVYIPVGKAGGRPRSVDMREIVNGMLYVLRSGCAWRMLPHDLPKWQTVYTYFRAWQASGVWQRMVDGLREDARIALERNPQPSAVIIDSQSVKTIRKGGHAALTDTSG
jgi:putative transposase